MTRICSTCGRIISFTLGELNGEIIYKECDKCKEDKKNDSKRNRT